MNTDDGDVLLQALRWLREGRRVALATVARTWGSAPRGAGSHMAVCDTGDFAGSVSGGCVEAAVVQEAAGVLADGRPRLLSYGVSDEEAWAVGLSCGGRLEVYLEACREEDLAALEKALAVRDGAVALVWMERGGRAVLGASEPVGPVPRHRSIPEALQAAAGAAYRTARTAVVESGEGPVLVRPYVPPPRLVIVGAVHVTQPLVKMACEAGFEVEVIDPRRAFATRERLPGVALRTAWPDEALGTHPPDARTAVVTLSHDPKLDDPALLAALDSPAFYVGALGSRRTHQRRRARLADALRARGSDPALLDRIHAPVGLDIGARTPAEIAVAVVAEVIAALRKEDGAS